MVVLYKIKHFLSLRVLLLTAFALVCISVPAQSKKMKAANALFDAKEYIKAIDAYKAILKDNQFAPGVKSKIGDCYRLTNSFSTAQKYYAEVVNTNERQPMDMFNYAECLKLSGNISEAKKWYGEYVKMVPGDKNALSKFASCSAYLDSVGSVKCSNGAQGDLTFSSPESGKINVPVVFNASKIQIKGEQITEYFWDFDENTPVTGGSSAKHSFSENRPHTVKLYITTDKNGGHSIHCSSKVIDIRPGYKPGGNNLLEMQKQDAELREKTPKKQQ